MKEIDEELEELNRLYNDGLLRENDYLKKLREISKRKEELRQSVNDQKAKNLKIVRENFTENDLLILLNLKR